MCKKQSYLKCYFPDFQDNKLVTLFLLVFFSFFFFPGVLRNVQDDFHIGNDLGGLLQTAFVLSYMIFAPLFGYLGDRYSRRWIMAFGVLLWSLTTLLGSFMHVSCAYELLVLPTVQIIFSCKSLMFIVASSIHFFTSSCQ